MLQMELIPSLVDSELLHYLGELVHEAKALPENKREENSRRQAAVRLEISKRGLLG